MHATSIHNCCQSQQQSNRNILHADRIIHLFPLPLLHTEALHHRAVSSSCRACCVQGDGPLLPSGGACQEDAGWGYGLGERGEQAGMGFASSLSQGRTLLQPLNLLDSLSASLFPVLSSSFSLKGNFSTDFAIGLSKRCIS